MNCNCGLPAHFHIARDGRPGYSCPCGRCRFYALAPVQCEGYHRLVATGATSPTTVFVRLEAMLHPQTQALAVMAYCEGGIAGRADVQAVLQDETFDVAWYTTREAYLYPMAHYGNLLRRLRGLPDVLVQEIPNFFFRCREQLLRIVEDSHNQAEAAPLLSTSTTNGSSTSEDCVFAQLRPFQRRGVEFIVRHGGRGMIADDMGLGKTVQAIAFAHHYRAEWPVLVVCPMSLLENWVKEFNRFCSIPFARMTILQGTRATPGPTHDVVIVSYASLKCVEASAFNVIILDESHYIKAGETKRTQLALQLCRRAKRVVLLSGTPAMSRPSELYTQMQAIHPTCVPTRTQFTARYCNSFVSRFGVDVSGHSHIDELHCLLQHFVIRRSKKELGAELPSKTRQLLYVYVTEKERKALEKQVLALRHAMGSTATSGGVCDYASRAPNAFELKNATARAKIPAVQDYIASIVEQHLEAREKLIIFAHHQCMMQAIKAAVEAVRPKQPIDYILIAGDTPAGQREQLMEHFRNVASCAVAILSMQSSGTGHNLTCASTIVFAELDWNPSTHLQCEDRVHRIGQAEPCTIKYLLAEGTSDSVIWPLLQSKLGVTTAVLESSAKVNEGRALLESANTQQVSRRDTNTTTSEPSAGMQSTLDGFVKAVLNPTTKAEVSSVSSPTNNTAECVAPQQVDEAPKPKVKTDEETKKEENAVVITIAEMLQRRAEKKSSATYTSHDGVATPVARGSASSHHSSRRSSTHETTSSAAAPAQLSVLALLHQAPTSTKTVQPHSPPALPLTTHTSNNVNTPSVQPSPAHVSDVATLGRVESEVISRLTGLTPRLAEGVGVVSQASTRRTTFTLGSRPSAAHDSTLATNSTTTVVVGESAAGESTGQDAGQPMAVMTSTEGRKRARTMITLQSPAAATATTSATQTPLMQAATAAAAATTSMGDAADVVVIVDDSPVVQRRRADVEESPRTNEPVLSSAVGHKTRFIFRSADASRSIYITPRATRYAMMDQHDRELGFVGKEVLFRPIEFERYRKPQVVEYPRHAIVLNPHHTQRQQQQQQQSNDKQVSSDDDDKAGCTSSNSTGAASSEEELDENDPYALEQNAYLCSNEALRGCMHLRWRSVTAAGLGLANLGNTCFANCVLQAIAYTPALAQYFTSVFRAPDKQIGAPYDFAYALGETLRQLQRSSSGGAARSHTIGGGRMGSSSYRPALIVGQLRALSPRFSLGRQSDAHEFATQLLFACQRCILFRLVGNKKLAPLVGQTTALYRMCGGYLRSQVTWRRQEEIEQLLRAKKRQAATDLQMEVLQLDEERSKENGMCNRDALNGNSQESRAQLLRSNAYDPFTILSVELAGHTLHHCLERFFAEEQLQGRCYYTPREVAVHATKRFSLHVAPPVFVVQLKRFDAMGNKVNKFIQYPTELDLQAFANEQLLRRGKATSLRYELNAVCVHQGHSLNYGHYYTVVRAGNGAWYECNDELVTPLSEERALRLQAYMLFYSRIASEPLDVSDVSRKRARHAMQRSDGSGMMNATLKEERLQNGHVHMGIRQAVMQSDMPVADGGDEVFGKALSDAEVAALLRAQKRASAASVKGTSHESNLPSNVPETTPCTNGPFATPKAVLQRLRDDVTTDEDDDDAHTSVEHNGEDKDTTAHTMTNGHRATSRNGVIKSITRHEVQAGTAIDGQASREDGRPARVVVRTGSEAVATLLRGREEAQPETTRRPSTAPKFQQRMRDPLWEMTMDRGRLKKVKKPKAHNLQSGTNRFQQVASQHRQKNRPPSGPAQGHL